jgi:hypothetical protein
VRARWKFLAVAAAAGLLGVLTTSGSEHRVPETAPAEAPQTVSEAPEDSGVSEAASESKEHGESILGAYTTYYKDGPEDGRAHNITKLSVALNFVVAPGEIWSFNEAVGPRTKERGYLPAPTIVLGEMTESYGGGTCQVSSTLFVAALRAGLEIVERRPHSRPSSYIPKGMDATVSYPEECWVDKPDPRICPDLKIKNPYDFPIAIKGLGGLEGPDGGPVPEGKGALEVIIMGEGEPPKVTMKWRSWKTTDPEERFRKVLRKGAKSFRKQKPALGVEGVLVVKINGEELRFISRYKPVHEVWYVPVDWEEDAGAAEAYPEEP